MDQNNSQSRFQRFFRFAVVGVSGVVVNVGILHFLVELVDIPPHFASPVAILISIFNNFTWNDYWTWKENRHIRIYGYFQRLIRYYLSALFSGIINYSVLLGLNYGLGLSLFLANLTGIGAGMAFNYLLSEYWVFRSRSLPYS